MTWRDWQRLACMIRGVVAWCERKRESTPRRTISYRDTVAGCWFGSSCQLGALDCCRCQAELSHVSQQVYDT
jgi:hypothetical protein